MIPFSQIEQAHQRIQAHVHRTPLLTSHLLNQWLGHEVFFKAECLQKIGAFKARGGCNAVASLIERGEKPERIVANSSGNHAQAVAWAAKQFEIPTTIFMPANSSQVKIQATRSYGATVELVADRILVDAAVSEAAAQPGTYWIPPYNHADVIAGQGTATIEALQQIDQVDALFAPCGGGGLLSGSFIAARGSSLSTQVIGVEPILANDAAQSRREGKIVRFNETPKTIADGVRTPAVGAITFEYIRQLDDFYEVSEDAIVYWTQWLTHLLKLNIEPTSAMVLSGVCQWLRKQTGKKRVVVILSGGNIDQTTHAKIWETDYLGDLPHLAAFD